MTVRPMIPTLSATSLALLAGALLLAPAQLRAQDGDARWLPWVGCWETTADAGEASAAVCFRPDGVGVEVLTVVDGAVAARDVLRADGQPREQSAEGCSGTEAVDFSDDGRRIYLTSEQVCEGGTRRSATGIIAMVSPAAWIDVKSVEVEGERLAMVQLYRPASPATLQGAGLEGLTAGREMALRTARIAASIPPSPDDVVEASRRVHAEAVQAWLAEAAEPFELNARLLQEMAGSGVASETLDVMVAVSYPDRFVLNQGARADRGAAVEASARTREAMEAYGMEVHDTYRGTRSPFFWDPFYASAYGFRYGYGRLGYGYGIDSFGYGFDPYLGWLGYRPTVVVVEPEGGSRGRVVNGRGYTRRGTSYPTGRSGTVGGATRSGEASGTTGTGSTTRRAKPRGGGGDGGSR